MRRPLLAPASLLLAVALAAAPAAAQDAVSPDALSQITATTSKRANVRYAPSTNARIACTLDAGDQVEIVGPSEVKDWFVVRFPRKAQAWVHDKNLQPIDGGKHWRVTGDGVIARDDATLKGNIVTQLAVGEVLEDRASARGSWKAVYIPSAIAYVHQSVLNVPNAEAIQQQQAEAQRLDGVWQQAQARYGQVYRQLKDRPESAADLDLAPLKAPLEQVAKGHADSAVRMSANRILKGLADVEEKGRQLRESRGGAPATTTGGGATKPPADGPVTKIPTGDQQDPLQVPPGQEPPANAPQTPVTAQPPALPAVPPTFAASGFVSENTDYPKAGAPHLLLDSNSNVVAFLAPRAGATVNLAEFYWRWVGVSGERKTLDQAAHGLGKDIPLIEVDAVQLVRK